MLVWRVRVFLCSVFFIAIVVSFENQRRLSESGLEFLFRNRINHNATPHTYPVAGPGTLLETRRHRRTTLEDEDSVREYCVTTSNAKFQAFLSESRNESMDQHMLCVVDVPLYAIWCPTPRGRGDCTNIPARIHMWSRSTLDLRAGPSII